MLKGPKLSIKAANSSIVQPRFSSDYCEFIDVSAVLIKSAKALYYISNYHEIAHYYLMH